MYVIRYQAADTTRYVRGFMSKLVPNKYHDANSFTLEDSSTKATRFSSVELAAVFKRRVVSGAFGPPLPADCLTILEDMTLDELPKVG